MQNWPRLHAHRPLIFSSATNLRVAISMKPTGVISQTPEIPLAQKTISTRIVKFGRAIDYPRVGLWFVFIDNG